MKDVICIMGKSGCGKSSLIAKMIQKAFNEFYYVKSYTTRAIRETDPCDKDTHVFVDKDFYEKHKKDIVALYHDKVNNYYSWTDDSSFSNSKINIYAIDPKAYVNLVKSDKFSNILGIYLKTDEEERKKRIEKRGGKYKEEKHLSLDILKNTPEIKDTYIVVDNTNLNIDETINEILLKIIEKIEG